MLKKDSGMKGNIINMKIKIKDDLIILVDALRKREEILIKKQPMSKYNRYFDIMRKSARKLIIENRQDELLPYLESDSISIQHDVAGLLYNCYPDKCREVLQRISDMTVKTGLQMCFSNCCTSAYMTLKYGIPKDYP